MTLVVTDADGNPAPNAQVAFYIFNEVGNEPYMRSSFEGKADDEGRFTFDVGPGDYLVQAKSGGSVGWAIANSALGKKAECPIILGTPGPESGEGGTKRMSGSGCQLQLMTNSGAGDCRIAVCKLTDLPWKPVKWVEFTGPGQCVDLDPGSYLFQSAWRKGDSTVHMILLPVKLEAGDSTHIMLPGRFPKRPPKGPPKDGAYVLTYPRR